METNTEQLAQAGEQDAQSSETKQQPPASDAKAQTSTTGAQAAESITKTPNVTLDFNSPEFAEAVKKVAFPLAQSMKDKELKPLKEKLSAYEEKEAEAKLEAAEKAEAEQWETEGHSQAEIRDFQEARKRARKEYASYDREKADFDQKRLSYEAKSALYDALYEALPQEKIDYLIKESEGHPKAMRLLAKEIAAELKKAAAAPAETEKPAEKKSPSRPDPSGHSAPGGIDFDSIPVGKEQIAYALKQKRTGG